MPHRKNRNNNGAGANGSNNNNFNRGGRGTSGGFQNGQNGQNGQNRHQNNLHGQQGQWNQNNQSQNQGRGGQGRGYQNPQNHQSNPRNNKSNFNNGNGNGNGGQGKWCIHCQKNNHNTADCRRQNPNNGTGNNSNFNNGNGNGGGPKQCNNCGKRSHDTAECRRGPRQNPPTPFNQFSQNNQNRTRPPPKRPCKHCGELHYDNECPLMKMSDITMSDINLRWAPQTEFSSPCSRCRESTHYTQNCPQTQVGDPIQPGQAYPMRASNSSPFAQIGNGAGAAMGVQIMRLVPEPTIILQEEEETRFASDPWGGERFQEDYVLQLELGGFQAVDCEGDLIMDIY